MKYKFSPQRSDNQLSYVINRGQIIATLNGQTDVIDLSEVNQYPMLEDNRVLTKLLINPIISVFTQDGIKYVELLKFHKKDAPESERFGFDWQEI